MTPEETFHQLLGLGQSWKVVRTEFEEKEQTFVICVAETERLWPEESQRCGQEVICYDHVEPMQWRHLNVFNKEREQWPHWLCRRWWRWGEWRSDEGCRRRWRWL